MIKNIEDEKIIIFVAQNHPIEPSAYLKIKMNSLRLNY